MLRAWQFVTLLSTALLTGMVFCHVLEMPAKMEYSGSLYLTLHRTLYVAFGPPNIGVFVEMLAILSSLVLAFLMRKRPGFWAAVVGASCLVAGLVVYFMVVEPANVEMKAMSTEAPPAAWAHWRDQWETGHATHFGFALLGLSALIHSALAGRRVVPGAWPAEPGGRDRVGDELERIHEARSP